REVCLPVSERMLQGEDYATLRRRMLATVQDPENEGVGIAAPQVGVLRRMVAVQRFDKEGEPFEFFLNPEIVERIGEKQSGGEGCLSVPEIRGDVERWQKIRLRYHDEQFAEREEIIEGFTAVIFQHELDHLDGRLFIDYIE
ncbi:MAG: peptide deformylase, partial [Alistipes sp.]|nr:peptide deformylase [Alistipes sp.]